MCRSMEKSKNLPKKSAFLPLRATPEHPRQWIHKWCAFDGVSYQPECVENSLIGPWRKPAAPTPWMCCSSPTLPTWTEDLRRSFRPLMPTTVSDPLPATEYPVGTRRLNSCHPQSVPTSSSAEISAVSNLSSNATAGTTAGTWAMKSTAVSAVHTRGRLLETRRKWNAHLKFIPLNFVPQSAILKTSPAKMGCASRCSGNATGSMTAATKRTSRTAVRLTKKIFNASNQKCYSHVLYAPKGDCPTGQFKCQNKKCISEKNQCDSRDDCGDGSDEINCGRSKKMLTYVKRL